MAKDNLSIEEEVKNLHKHMGTVVKMMQNLKCSVEVLEKKMDIKENQEIKEIIDAQSVIDEILVANSDAIKRIDKEIVKLSKQTIVVERANDTSEDDKDTKVENRKTKKCKYFNRGYCKHKSKCRFIHPEQICEEYLEKYKCERKECSWRHPIICKWLSSRSGCTRGSDCTYLHVNLVDVEQIRYNNLKNTGAAIMEYKCSGCKSSWTEKCNVKEHVIQNMQTFFCLNCDDYIKDKTQVFNKGWTLVDEHGFLRRDL